MVPLLFHLHKFFKVLHGINGLGYLNDTLCPAFHALAHYWSRCQFDSDQNLFSSNAISLDLLDLVSDHNPFLAEKAVCNSQLS